MSKARIMEQESPTERIHAAIVGAEKNGKSWLFATAPGNKLNLDYDQRADALAGKKGVYAYTFEDPGGFKMPTAVEETLDIIASLERSLEINQITVSGKPIFPSVPAGTKLNAVGVDSMISLCKCVADYEMYNNPDLCRTVQVGAGNNGYKVRVQKGFDPWMAEGKTVESIILRLFALPLQVYAMWHECAEESVDSTPEKRKFTNRITIFPDRYATGQIRILRYFNEVWRVKNTSTTVTVNGKAESRYLPKVYPLPDYAMDAATAMLLDPIEEPNIEAMIAKHKLRSGQTKALPVAISAGK